VREADTNWVTPITNAPLGAVVRALCDRDFKRPFAGKKYAVAKPAPSAPPPASASIRMAEAAPPSPALRPALPATKPGPVKPAPKPETASAAASAPSAPKDGRAVAVQIGAGAKPDLEALLAKIRKTHAADLSELKTEVVTVQSDGKTVNRALISGFGSAAEAGAFCKKLANEGQACFIRR
jgi:hypothetical protein